MIWTELHLLRPLWLWALLPLLGLLWLLWRRRLASRRWQAIVAPQLLPHLLVGSEKTGSPWGLITVACSGLLAIIALAGPVLEQLEQPVFRQQSTLVVLLDLSRSMDATDIRPSRLARARLKLHDILAQRSEGQTALLTYAADPYVVAPLTTDNRTIASQLPSLTTDLMPRQGSRIDRALARGLQLLQQAGVAHGTLLLISDGVEGAPDAALASELKKLRDAGHRLLVLGVGSRSGAPIAQPNGGFLEDAEGAIILPKLDESALRQLAQQGNGLYHRLTADDSDIERLLAQVDADHTAQFDRQSNSLMSDQWREEGPWLLLPLLLIAAVAFRRGYLVVVLALLLSPQPEGLMAAEGGVSWQQLWARDDQRAQQALDAGRPQEAAKLFSQPERQGAAYYQAGEFEAAQASLQGVESAQAHYNRGNALTQLGRFEEALEAYDEALQYTPEDTDAQHNRALVEQWLKQEQQKSDKPGEEGEGSQGEEGEGEESKASNSQSSETQQPGDQDSSEGAQESPEEQQGEQRQEGEQTAQSGDESEDSDESSEAISPQEMAAEEDSQKGAEKPLTRPDPEDAAVAQQSEQQQAMEQWLRRIPDDPGGLWRRKFLYQYQRQQQQQKREEQPW